MNQLPHDWIAVTAAGLAVSLFVLAGVRLFLPLWESYQRRYLEDAAVTMDAMYIAMPAQNILYLSFLSLLLGIALIGSASADWRVGLILGMPWFLLPRIALWLLKRRRDELFNVQLVDGLVNISNSLRAGFTLPQALDLIHREMPPPLSQEVRLVSQELRLGVPMDEALQNLYRRMPLADVDLVVTAIAIVREVGGNLTEVFENIAFTIRERQRIEGKIKALTAMGRTQATVVCLLPFALLAVLSFVAPHLYMNMISDPRGWIMIGAILLLEALAIVVIIKIVTIDI